MICLGKIYPTFLLGYILYYYIGEILNGCLHKIINVLFLLTENTIIHKLVVISY